MVPVPRLLPGIGGGARNARLAGCRKFLRRPMGFKKALRSIVRASQLNPRDYMLLRQSYASLGRRKLVDVGDADALRASPPRGDEMNMIGISCCRRRLDTLHQDPKSANTLGLDVVRCFAFALRCTSVHITVDVDITSAR
jgi:hypothetical protein